jgi:hypothetical protein
VQLAGFKNRPVSQATWQAVENWLATAHCQTTNGGDEGDPF